MITLITFIVLLALTTIGLNPQKLDTAIKCGRWLGALLASAIVFSPSVTIENSTAFFIFFPLFYVIGFVLGAIYRYAVPFKHKAEVQEVNQTTTNTENTISENAQVAPNETWVMDKRLGITIFIVVSILLICLTFQYKIINFIESL